MHATHTTPHASQPQNVPPAAPCHVNLTTTPLPTMPVRPICPVALATAMAADRVYYSTPDEVGCPPLPPTYTTVRSVRVVRDGVAERYLRSL